MGARNRAVSDRFDAAGPLHGEGGRGGLQDDSDPPLAKGGDGCDRALEGAGHPGHCVVLFRDARVEADVHLETMQGKLVGVGLVDQEAVGIEPQREALARA